MIFDPYQPNRLTGEHARLYRESLATMLDVYREELIDGRLVAHWTFGVPAFDTMTVRRQFESLIRCSAAVLEGSGSPRQWMLGDKAAFYAVYMNVLQQIEIEEELSDLGASAALGRDFADDVETVVAFDDAVDLLDEDSFNWREMIRDAWRHECDGRPALGLPGDRSPDSDTIQECRWLLERLADFVLPDRQFENQGATESMLVPEWSPLPMGAYSDPLSDDFSPCCEAPGMPELAGRLADLAGARGLHGATEEPW